MSVEYCTECERITEGETIIAYGSESPDAYEDGDYDLICPFCHEATVINVNDEHAQG